MAFHVLDATSEEKVSKKNDFFQCAKKMTMIVLQFKKNDYLCTRNFKKRALACCGIVEFSTLKARACGEIGRRARLRI